MTALRRAAAPLLLLAIGLLFFPSGGRDDAHIGYWVALCLSRFGRVMNYNGAIASLIEERTGRTVAAILQKIRAVGAPAGIAEALRTAPNAHALEITRRYEDSAGDTFVISISVHRADRFTYFSRLKRQRRP